MGPFQVFFPASLFFGVAFLVAAVFVARLHWRSDVEPYGRKTEFLKFLERPDRYVRPKAVLPVRILRSVGTLFFLCALLALAGQLWEDLASR